MAARIEKQPPANPEAEGAVLGALLIDPDCKSRITQILQPADFSREQNRQVFEAILALGDAPVDVLTVEDVLQRRGQLDGLGWGYLNKLVADCPTSLHAVHYAGLVADTARRRRWINAAGRIATAAYSDNGDDPGAVAELSLAEDKSRRLPGEVRFSTWADLDGLLSAVAWAWPGWLPAGFLSILAGEQETGKSALALRIAGSLLAGYPWPDGQPCQTEPGAVLWCEAEAGQGINRDRARAWGLPVDRIFSPLSDPLADFRLDNPEHVQSLQVAAGDPGVKAVILDSLSGAHGRRENDSEMVSVIKTLAEIARNSGKPILLTHHLRKRSILDVGDDGPSLERIRGSGAISQTARAVWTVDRPDPNLPERRRLTVVKCNLSGQKPKPLGFTIDDGGLTFGPPPEPPKEETQLDRAIELLQTLLDAGPMAATAIEQEAAGAAISWATVRRAKESLHIVARRLNGRWVWALPVRDSDNIE